VGAEGSLLQRLLADLPAKVELLADIAIVPSGAMKDSEWNALPALGSAAADAAGGGGGEGAGAGASLPERGNDTIRGGAAGAWAVVARAIGVDRILRKAEVDSGPTRSSRAELVADLNHVGPWVEVREHGTRYCLNVEKVMFSRGNVNERARAGGFPALGETVVDMFAGIGYFTLPLALRAKPARIVACDWNPDAVECLRKNVELNKVGGIVEVREGDNREQLKDMVG